MAICALNIKVHPLTKTKEKEEENNNELLTGKYEM